MNTIGLARLLVRKLGWSYAGLAEKIGITRQVAHRVMNDPIKTERRDKFVLGVIRTAFKHGCEAEALSVILGDDQNLKVSSVLRAAIMYPDLKPTELEQLIKAEKETHMSPLPLEVIRSIIETLR